MSEKDYGISCSHLGVVYIPDGGTIPCGDDGQLCPACREDKDDARIDRLVEGLALAGLLANGNFTDATLTAMKDSAPDISGRLLNSATGVSTIARVFSAALRDREGGGGS